mgnify:CR=1 FL=1
MKKLKKSIILIIIGIGIGYYVCFSGSVENIFKKRYKAFQIGVFTDMGVATTYSSKYNNSIIVNDNELYRVYYAILKQDKNINTMSKYLDSLGIEYYLKDIEISYKKLISEIKSMFVGLKQEKLLAIYLDNKKRLINYKVITIGTKDETMLHPRDVIYNAIKCNASSVIIIHNHPSGDVIPSRADIEMTNRLMDACNIVGIPLLDHLITNSNNYYSFFKENNNV